MRLEVCFTHPWPLVCRPSVINVNPVTLVDDAALKATDECDAASMLTFGAVAFNEEIVSGALPVERSRHGPLDMSQFHSIFSVARIPCPVRDQLEHVPPHLSRHIVVQHDGNMYKVAVDHPQEKRTLSVAEWKAVFDAIKGQQRKSPRIALLTGGDRDNWAAAYAELGQVPSQSSFVLIVVDWW